MKKTKKNGPVLSTVLSKGLIYATYFIGHYIYQVLYCVFRLLKMVRKFQLEQYKGGGNSGPGSCVLQEHSLKLLGIQGIIIVPYFRPFQSQEKSPSKFYELVVFQQTNIRAFFF